ncbi:hypothetical protein QNO21_00700 [Microbacterium sp. zg-Y818]|uniref:hypothetical protein n=1 Tax=unclassified Microbacterium TaxID=2609290 RepID=UPI00214C0450|nr:MULTISPECIES: hypothetical protein [unclassified Microbacterium]MCR2802041.1 hypothetical protein [Microbacterium sp. zg.Y818]WIM22592.1 hypothetical protein QNO21_00700 [Microbacterium sp. zg-Y818]
MSRYVYLLGTLPPTVIERAHEAAFGRLPLEQRQEMFAKLRPFMSERERVREPQPALLASVLQRLAVTGSSGARGSLAVAEGDRRADGSGGRAEHPGIWPFDDPILIALVAGHFLTSATLVSYFSVGAGSLALAGEPAWVGEIAGVPADGAGGGFGGDGGFGGMDGGGFGGGFDGGGGFGG